MTSVAILHYAGPPVVGGVESTMYYHAHGLRQLGYEVKIVSGSGSAYDSQIQTIVVPLLGSRNPEILAAKAELDKGVVPSEFDSLVARILAALEEHLAGVDTCIVHNVLTLNKNLPFTAALKRYTEKHTLHLLAWCHDLAWANKQYLPELYEAYPWTLMKERWQHVNYVTVSEPRSPQLANLLGISEHEVTVVVPGVDPAEFYHWTPTTLMLNKTLKLLDAEGILLLPARLTRRKNISLALRVLEELLNQSGKDFRLIVTGPPGPHNPKNMGYLGELLKLRKLLTIEGKAHFLYEYGGDDQPLVPDNSTIANLYHLADLLFFPSIQEGFGIPMLEAGFAGLPVFCSDIPPFRTTGQEDVHYFDPATEYPDKLAARILKMLEHSPTSRLRVRVRQSYRWESIIREQIVPLLQKGTPS